MDRDRPPYGPSDDADVSRPSEAPHRGRDDDQPRTGSGGDREKMDRPRFASRDRTAPRLPVEPTFDADSDLDAPKRSFERMGRFSRDGAGSKPGERREPVLGSERSRPVGPSTGREEPRPTGFSARRATTERSTPPEGSRSAESKPTADRDVRPQPSFRSRDRSTEPAPAAPEVPRERNRFLSGDRARSERPPFDPRGSSVARARDDVRPAPPTVPLRPAADERRAAPSRPASGERSWRADLAARSSQPPIEPKRPPASERSTRPETAEPAPGESVAPRRERPSFVDRERYSMRMPERFAADRPEAAPAAEPAAAPWSDPTPIAAPAPAAQSGDGDRSARPKRDWRSLRFSSRFAQPPKAYDLDEVGDRELSFDESASQEQRGPAEPQYAPASNLDDGSRDDDAALRRRFGRVRPASREPEPDYTMDVEPESPYADDDPAAEDLYAGAETVDDRAPFEERDDLAVGGYDDEDDYAADRYREPAAAPLGSEAYPIAESEYAETGYDTADFEPAPAYEDPEEPVDRTPRSRAQTRARDQLVYDDFDIRDRGEPPIAAVVDDRYDDFGAYADEPDPLRAEPRAGLDADPASYRGTFEDYEKKGRRGPMALLLALGGVAVVAGGLIVGYQIFSSDGGDRVPLVKLEDTPSKVAPDEPGGMSIPHQNKLIYDRIVGENSPVDEQVVPREEPVIDLNSQGEERQAGEPDSDLPAPPDAEENAVGEAAGDDTGRQEAADILRGDQSSDGGQLSQNFGVPVPPPGFSPSDSGTRVVEADPEPRDEPDATPEPSRIETISPPERSTASREPPPQPKLKPAIPPEPADVAPRSSESSAGPIQLSRPSDTSGGPAPAPSTAVESAPLSQAVVLPPPAPEPVQQQRQQVARAEPAPAPVTSSASGDYVVQTAAFRSEEEARDEYRKLRDKHGGLIASYGPLIQKADLGSRGVYYRLRLGPIDSKGAASNLCDSLLAAGEKDCLVRRQ